MSSVRLYTQDTSISVRVVRSWIADKKASKSGERSTLNGHSQLRATDVLSSLPDHSTQCMWNILHELNVKLLCIIYYSVYYKNTNLCANAQYFYDICILNTPQLFGLIIMIINYICRTKDVNKLAVQYLGIVPTCTNL